MILINTGLLHGPFLSQPDETELFSHREGPSLCGPKKFQGKLRRHGSAEERLSLFCSSISKLNERPIKGKISSYGAPYIPTLKDEA